MMKNEELERLEEKFIRKKDLEEEKIKQLIENISNYAVVDKKGRVEISRDVNLNQRNKVWLVLCAEYLANKLQTMLDREEVINAEMKASDIAKMLNKERATMSARLKELHEDDCAERLSRGVYRAKPHKIENLLEVLEK